MFKSSFRLYVLLTLPFIAACTTSEKKPHPGLLSLTQPRHPLNVKTIAYESTYKAGPVDQYADRLMPTPPEKIIVHWLKERFYAAGTEGKATFIVENARITTHGEPHQKNFFSDTLLDYTGHFTVKLSVREHGSPQKWISSSVVSTRQMPQSLTLYKRQATLLQMTESLINALNESLLKSIQAQFPGLILKKSQST